MNEADYADALYADIVSGDFSAFQKRLHEIEGHPSFLREVFAYNPMGLGQGDRFTLVQSATVYALETGDASMLMELIRLGAPTTWGSSLPPLDLRRQTAMHFKGAEYFVHNPEADAYYELSEAENDSVADTDSVDELFERAVAAGNLHAAGIMAEVSALWGRQLTNIADSITNSTQSLSFMSPIVSQYLDFTDLIQGLSDENVPASDGNQQNQNPETKKSPNTNKSF